MSLLTASGIYKEYQANQKSLIKTDITISKGSRLGIVGETGSGKSTLLKILAGLEQPTGGEVQYRDKRVLGPDEQLVAGHPSIVYLAQNFELRKFVTVEECIYSPYKLSEAEAYKIYKACDIEHLINRKTHELSGGEKQRVALAVLLAKKPDLLLLDEPFSSLDPHHKQTIKEVINNIESQLKTTVTMVAHDPTDILSWASFVVVMKAGKIVQKGSPYKIYQKPKNRYVAGLFGQFNLLSIDNDIVKQHKLNGKIFLRPEAIIVTKSNNEIKGIIKDKRFFGMHDELMIESEVGKIIAYAEVGKFEAGNKVGLKIKS